MEQNCVSVDKIGNFFIVVVGQGCAALLSLKNHEGETMNYGNIVSSCSDCEVGGEVFSLGHLEDISVNYNNTASSYSEGSYDEDRPQSVIKKHQCPPKTHKLFHSVSR